jgi:hypothetical protein
MTESITGQNIIFDFLKQNIGTFQYLNHDLRDNKEFVEKLLELDGSVLQYASSRLQADKELVRKAVRNNPLSFKYASTELQQDLLFSAKMARINTQAIEHLDDETKEKIKDAYDTERPEKFLLWDDKELVLKIVNKDGFLLRKASDSLKADKDVVTVAATRHSDALEHANESVLTDTEFMTQLVEKVPRAIKYAKKRTKEMALKAVKRDGSVLAYVGEFKNDSDVIIAAVQENPKAFNYVTAETLQDVNLVDKIAESNVVNDWSNETVKHLVKTINDLRHKVSSKLLSEMLIEMKHWKSSSEMVEKIKPYLRDKGCVLHLLETSGCTTKFIMSNLDDTLKTDRDIAKTCLSTRLISLVHLHPLHRADRDLVKLAIKNGNSLKYADESLRRDKELVMLSVAIDYENLKHADDSLKKDKDFILSVLDKSYQAIKYADPLLRKDCDIVNKVLEKVIDPDFVECLEC